MTKLQAERRRLGLSQTALAAKAERLSASDISRFERRYGRPYPNQAARLARVLGLTPSELLDPAETPSDRQVGVAQMPHMPQRAPAEVSSPAEGSAKCVCSWCGVTVREGALPVNHGICQACELQLLAEADQKHHAIKTGTR